MTVAYNCLHCASAQPCPELTKDRLLRKTNREWFFVPIRENPWILFVLIGVDRRRAFMRRLADGSNPLPACLPRPQFRDPDLSVLSRTSGQAQGQDDNLEPMRGRFGRGDLSLRSGQAPAPTADHRQGRGRLKGALHVVQRNKSHSLRPYPLTPPPCPSIRGKPFRILFYPPFRVLKICEIRNDGCLCTHGLPFVSIREPIAAYSRWIGATHLCVDLS